MHVDMRLVGVREVSACGHEVSRGDVTLAALMAAGLLVRLNRRPEPGPGGDTPCTRTRIFLENCLFL